jgi:glycerol-3-phosphate acyltransferase PlsX
VIKSHGSTDAEGFAAAIDVGYDMVRYGWVSRIGEALAQYKRGGDRALVVGEVAS